MNHRNPSFIERVTAALMRWAEEQHRLAEDESYWEAAQHDPRLMADITCALARSQPDGAVPPTAHRAPSWSMLSPLVSPLGVARH